MTETLLSSTGVAGEIEERSAGRSYLTSNNRFTNSSDLLATISEVANFAFKKGSRRWVHRSRCSHNITKEIEEKRIKPSVNLPFSELGLGEDSLITFEENIHESDIPEWNDVYDYWKLEKKYPEPTEEIEKLLPGFSLTKNFNLQDRDTLYELWKPFGWTKPKIDSFIKTYKNNNNLWVSGVRDEKGQLASACMGEALVFDGVYMVEATEFGTRNDLRGKNLSTVAVVGLIAQIIQRSLYAEKTMPLIIAEFNMSSRSDVVGRKVGMTIPGVEGVENLTEPTQILRKNVAVLDGIKPNSLSYGQFPPEIKEKYRDSFKDRFRFWRNFIVGMLTKNNIEKYYSEDKVSQILSRFIN